ncbi:glycerate kinase [Shewanella corallii]|uniref:Glycerate kinase n=1 Tax=Shewanella corallii TaxID=560080 RepID=A0ABT0N462_9GAMM|nr:glycerate kinase [Shewanella corallii]MCL2913208.1 glycerate kinase [Shewanella corallii]
MKIVIAPDSFKESLSALEVARAIEKGFKREFPDADYQIVPMADGGEGTVDALVDATGGKLVHLDVTGPLGNRVQARYGILGDNGASSADKINAATAIIEMASASGLHLVPQNLRDPLLTSSFGTGELIRDALDKGVRHLILGLGGSATNDGGAGMLQALGAELLNAQGQSLPAGGEALLELAAIDLSELHPALKQTRIDVACDVDNPLCGIRGASHIFGPQKGATQEMVHLLDKALGQFAHVVCHQWPDKAPMALLPGTGAAGGMGYAMVALLDASLTPGVELVITALDLDAAITGANLVITGEGRIDGQTVYGKTPMGVLNTAKRHNVPCIALAGCLGQEADAIKAHGMKAIFPIVPASVTLEQALATGAANLERTAANVAGMMRLAQS